MALAQRVLAWAADRKLSIWWGRGANSGSFFPMLKIAGRDHYLASFWKYGNVEVQFQNMTKPFDDRSLRMEILQRLNAIPGVSLAEARIAARPSFPLSALAGPTAMDEFLAIFDWYWERVRAGSIGP